MKQKTKMKKDIRLLEMFFYLAKQKDYITTKDLSKKFNINRRSVFRYLKDLRQAGIRINSKRKGIKISVPKLLSRSNKNDTKTTQKNGKENKETAQNK